MKVEPDPDLCGAPIGPGSAVAVAADVSTADGVKKFSDEFAKLEKKLDILVNNAGANWGASYESFPEAAFDKVMALNVKGVFLLTRDLTPLLKAAASAENPARVINIGSIDGIRIPELETYSYSASKAAVHQLTKTMANKLATENVRDFCLVRFPPLLAALYLPSFHSNLSFSSDHCQCYCCRPFPVQDDEGHSRKVRRRDRRWNALGPHWIH